MTLKRSPFAKPALTNAVKRDRSAEFASFTPQPRAIIERGWLLQVGAIAEVAPRQPAPILKTAGRKSQAIRDSARDEQCLVRLPGCDGGDETTVWCHLPEAVAGRGMGLKGVDVLGAYGCRSCHDIVDRRAPRPARMTEQDVALAFYRALARSVVRLVQKGLL